MEAAREVFDIGLAAGFNMNLLDIGGGFPGVQQTDVTMEKVSGYDCIIRRNKFTYCINIIILIIIYKHVKRSYSAIKMQLQH